MTNPDTAQGALAFEGQEHTVAQPGGRSRIAPWSSKIRQEHLDRVAIVYVRQSTPQQVQEHRESRARQYALADHAVALGWPQERVLVVDQDQAHSATSGAQRTGCERVLAELAGDHVGIVLGLELNRLIRTSKDWLSLSEVAGVFGTLLADQDGVYDPNDSNDRLLLGLKAMMSEVEMLTMRNRLHRGKLHKAQRGELFHSAPIGYWKLPSGQVEMEPDEQARMALQLVFDKFDELGTQWAVFRYLVRHNILLGRRVHQGPRAGELEWVRPTLAILGAVLHHPIYAGAYVYGRRATDRKRTASGNGKRRLRWVPRQDWPVLLRDRLPAYITWERYEANEQRLFKNRTLPGSAGTAREGAALLTGLVVCGRCGHCLSSCYKTKTQVYYLCTHYRRLGKEPVCSGLKAAVIDDLVVGLVLRALQPAALDLSLKAGEDVEQERQRLSQHWQKQLERARYESQRAERQYHQVEPENRLVARTLEQRWEEALRQERQLAEDYQRFLRNQPAALTAAEREAIQALAADLPALWQAPATTTADRKEILRAVVERVVVQVRKDSEYVEATIHWQGGFTSQHELLRPVRCYEQLRDYKALMDRIVQLHRAGQRAPQIADVLNREGFHPPRQATSFTSARVRQLLCREGLGRRRRTTESLGSQEWWLSDLAHELGMPKAKLRAWIVRGWLHARQTTGDGRWIAWADDTELERLRALKERSQRGVSSFPPELTTPKKRANV
jgi:DNA invertase Pin-like site-specific DNA recombinase